MSSGQLGMEAIKGYHKAGITALFQKPWNAEEILAKVKELISSFT